MAALTLAVPVAILVLAHWVVAEDFFQKQGAVVLLFFGWVTGTQLLFVTYRMRTENLWRLISLIVFSFAVVVLGYTAVSHAFGLFLYPEPELRSRIYAAAGIDLVWFDVLVGLITAVIVLGWLVTYYAERNGTRLGEHAGRLWLSFYALVSREFYVADVYAWLTRVLLAGAARLNLWLRWA
jgi:NADH-quinone oxidoreductase subunit L